VLDRLRAAAGVSGDELVEAVRRELRREYERGYVEGKGFRPPAPKETGFERFKRRMQRRMRHGAREWMANTRQLRKMVFNFVLVVLLSAAGIAIALRVSESSNDKKFAIPVVTR
jgi:hypothetical protein